MRKETPSLRGGWRRFCLIAGALWLCPVAAFAQEADGGDSPETPPVQSEEATPPQNDAPAARRPLTEADNALFAAIEIGDVNAARTALQQGAQADALNENDATPLMKAAFWGETEIVAALLEAKANPNRLNRQGQSPLLIAAMGGYLFPDNASKIREMALQQSRRPLSQAEQDELYALYRQNQKALTDNRDAINATKAEIARMLLEAGASPRVQAEEGATALHKAAATRNAAFIRWLLHYGASLYTLNASGETPLMRLLRDADGDDAQPLDALRVLLTPNGSDGKAAAVNKTGGWQGYAPLMEAVSNGHIEAARILLERGADPNRFNGAATTSSVRRNGNLRETIYETDRNSRQGVTALWVACEMSYHRNYPEMVSLLLSSGARADSKSSLGSPLIALLGRGPELMPGVPREKTLEVITKLLDAGADVNGRAGVDPYSPYQTAPGATPLLLAYRVGDLKIVTLLRERGASLSARDKFGANALSYAIRMPSDVIAGLLREGVSPEVYDSDGQTPLMQACSLGDPDVLSKIRLLLSAGANPNAIARTGGREAALHRIALNPSRQNLPGDADGKEGGGAGEIAARLLIEHGANLYIENQEKWTPLVAAIAAQNRPMVEAFLRLGADPRRRNSRGENALEHARALRDDAQKVNGDDTPLKPDHPANVILRLLESGK